MKKSLIVCIAILVVVLIAVAGYNVYRRPATFRHLTDNSLDEQQVNELKDNLAKNADKKILVTYFSYSGTTKNVATYLSDKTGGDLFEIKTKEDYSNVYTQSNREIRRGAKPELADKVSNMADYDIVFVGYPVWWHATPAPVNTFLESYDLKGKLIIPFCTSGSSDIEETMPTFLDSCDGLAVYGEKRIGSTGEVDGWLKELGLDIQAGANDVSEENGTTGADETSENTVSAGKDSASWASENASTTENAEPASGETSEKAADTTGNTLIVYFSWSSSGNTEKMATYIHEQTGADVLELIPANPYPTDYNETGDVAKAERDENARPEIANLPDSISEYDTILVGYPIWWHTAPMIIGTFLDAYDLTGVDIYPFSQSASMDTEQFANSMEFVRDNAAGANVHDGLFVDSSDTDGIDSYLVDNGLVN